MNSVTGAVLQGCAGHVHFLRTLGPAAMRDGETHVWQRPKL
jgi:hypothetical protein